MKNIAEKNRLKSTLAQAAAAHVAARVATPSVKAGLSEEILNWNSHFSLTWVLYMSSGFWLL